LGGWKGADEKKEVTVNAWEVENAKTKGRKLKMG